MKRIFLRMLAVSLTLPLIAQAHAHTHALALAHAGHGSGSAAHWHATDICGVLLVAAVLAAALATGRKR